MNMSIDKSHTLVAPRLPPSHVSLDSDSPNTWEVAVKPRLLSGWHLDPPRHKHARDMAPQMTRSPYLNK